MQIPRFSSKPVKEFNKGDRVKITGESPYLHKYRGEEGVIQNIAMCNNKDILYRIKSDNGVDFYVFNGDLKKIKSA